VLDSLKSLARFPVTPREILQEGIAKILDRPTEATLCQALEDICGCLPEPQADKKAYAAKLAGHFLATHPDDPTIGFTTFEQGLGPLKPLLSLAEACELLRLIRPLWVEPSDAAALRLAKKHQHHLAMNGYHIEDAGPDEKTFCYTLERFIERAWPLHTDKFLIVTLTEAKALGQIKKEIRDKCLGPSPPSRLPNADQLSDKKVNDDARTIVLLIPAYKDKGGLPDPVFLRELMQLFVIYQKIMLVFDLKDERPELPANVKYAQPRLADKDAMQAFLECEYQAYRGEGSARSYLQQLY